MPTCVLRASVGSERQGPSLYCVDDSFQHFVTRRLNFRAWMQNISYRLVSDHKATAACLPWSPRHWRDPTGMCRPKDQRTLLPDHQRKINASILFHAVSILFHDRTWLNFPSSSNYSLSNWGKMNLNVSCSFEVYCSFTTLQWDYFVREIQNAFLSFLTLYKHQDHQESFPE